MTPPMIVKTILGGHRSAIRQGLDEQPDAGGDRRGGHEPPVDPAGGFARNDGQTGDPASDEVDACADHARAFGCGRLALEVNTGNAPARALYRSLGFDVPEEVGPAESTYFVKYPLD